MDFYETDRTPQTRCVSTLSIARSVLLASLLSLLLVGCHERGREAVPSGLEFGAPCQSNDQCASDACLLVTDPFCTQECFDDCGCPTGTVCSPVTDTLSVCAPGENQCASTLPDGGIPDAEPPPDSSPGELPVPAAFRVYATTVSNVELRWSRVTSPTPHSYRFEHRPVGGTWEERRQGAVGDQNHIELGGFAYGSVFEIRMRALYLVDAMIVRGPYTEALSFRTRLVAPSDIQVEADPSRGIRVSWPRLTGATEYLDLNESPDPLPPGRLPPLPPSAFPAPRHVVTLEPDRMAAALADRGALEAKLALSEAQFSGRRLLAVERVAVGLRLEQLPQRQRHRARGVRNLLAQDAR